MLSIALELAVWNDRSYEDMASKFFEHFVDISDAMNQMSSGKGLWDNEDGFYYDQLRLDDQRECKLRVRSMVGLIPLYACLVLDDEYVQKLPGFRKRMDWFLENRKDLRTEVSCYVTSTLANRKPSLKSHRNELVSSTFMTFTACSLRDKLRTRSRLI